MGLTPTPTSCRGPRKSRAIPLLTLRAFVVYNKGENLPTTLKLFPMSEIPKLIAGKNAGTWMWVKIRICILDNQYTWNVCRPCLLHTHPTLSVKRLKPALLKWFGFGFRSIIIYNFQYNEFYFHHCVYTMRAHKLHIQLYVYGSVHRRSILIIVQRDATQSSLFIILQVHSTCFGCQPHPSSGVHKTVTAASCTGHIFCAATPLQRGQAWPVPEALATVLCTSDDGCGWHPKHVEWTCRIINRLLFVASRWTIINIHIQLYNVQ